MGKEQRRALILDTAARLFLHYGHAKTTIADIAREAGVAVGSVYLDFASKEEIVEALSSRAHLRVLEAMRTAARKSGSGFAARLTAAIEARTAAFLELRDEGQHARELVHCKAESVRGAHAGFLEDERALFRQLLEDAADAGELGPLDARRTAALVQRALATLSPPWVFEASPEESTSASAAMAELLLDGLLPRAGASEPKRRKRR